MYGMSENRPVPFCVRGRCVGGDVRHLKECVFQHAHKCFFNFYCPGCPLWGTFVHQGTQKTNLLAISQFSFPVTLNGLAMLYKSLSFWAKALKTYLYSLLLQ